MRGGRNALASYPLPATAAKQAAGRHPHAYSHPGSPTGAVLKAGATLTLAAACAAVGAVVTEAARRTAAVGVAALATPATRGRLPPWRTLPERGEAVKGGLSEVR